MASSGQGRRDPAAITGQGSLGVTQELARQVVVELGSAAITEYLEGRIQEVTDVQLRVSLIDAYARLKGRESTVQLTRLVADSSEPEDVRGAALRWLTEIGTDVASDAILAALADPAAGIRRIAVEATISLDDARVVERLIGAVEDPDIQVQAAAASALMTLNVREATGQIRRYFESNPSSAEAERARRFLDTPELATVVSNVPALPRMVAWRDRYITDIVSTFKKSSKSIIVVVGPGGSGKSTVANLVAREIESEFKLWLQAEHCQNGQLARSLMLLVIEGLGEKRPDLGYGSTSDDYTDLLKIMEADGRRFLLVLDGLDEVRSDHDALSAMALLGSIIEHNPNAMAVVTSRPTLTSRIGHVEIAYSEVGRLELVEIKTLIRSMMPSVSEEEVHRLAELSDGSALILQLLAARLAAIKQFSFDDIVALLDGFGSQSLWADVVSHLMDGANPASWIAVQVVALCGGGLRRSENVESIFATEGIEEPWKTFNELEARGIVVVSDRAVVLYRAAFKGAIEASMEPRDSERLRQKFRRRDYYKEYGRDPYDDDDYWY